MPATAAQGKADIRVFLEEIVARIKTQFDPETIILFGSQGRGTAGSDSDIDLLVVMPVNTSKREQQLQIRLAVRDIPVAKDIIVTTPEEFAWRKQVPGTIERPAAVDGEVLYARAG